MAIESTLMSISGILSSFSSKRLEARTAPAGPAAPTVSLIGYFTTNAPSELWVPTADAKPTATIRIEAAD